VVLAGLLVNTLSGSNPPARPVSLVASAPGRHVGDPRLALTASSVLLYNQRTKPLAVHQLSQHDARGYRGVVILLSPPSLPLERGRGGLVVGGVTLPPPAHGADRAEVLREAIDALQPVRWNWQQLLRALLPHVTTARHVSLIGSPGTAGSHGAYRDAAALIERYLESVTVHFCPAPVDFENLKELDEAIGEAVRDLEALGLSRGEITLDVTGGQKTASIAGAVFTLNNRVTFQYVQTGGACKPIQFDLEIAVREPP
jgi:hypothetical protein